MRAPKILLFISIMAILGCAQNSTDKSLKPSISSERDSISENEIYSFMRTVITEERLYKKYGLRLEYQPNCDLSMDDTTFLPTLLIENPEQIDTTEQTITYDSNGRFIGMTIKSYDVSLDKCLTNSDIEFMLQQKKNRSTFKWDNSKLGFDLNNKDFWYVFSIPLFSKDRTKAIIMIRDLCQGLCGGGKTVLFKKENNQWISQTGNVWVH